MCDCVLILIVGGIDVDSGTAESAAVFLFGHFFNSSDLPSSERSWSRLHTYFGPVSHRLCSDVYSSVQYIRSCLSDASVEKISGALDSATNIDGSANEEFGRHIKVALSYGPAVTDEDLDWLESDDDSDMCASGFNMNYSDVSQNRPIVSQVNARDVKMETTDVKRQKANGRAWLYEEVASYFCSESNDHETCVDDLVTSVFDILCSSRSNEQLQTEVSYSLSIMCSSADYSCCLQLFRSCLFITPNYR